MFLEKNVASSLAQFSSLVSLTQARQYAPAKGKVTVWEWEDGRLQIRYRGRAVAWEEITGPVPLQAVRPRETTARKATTDERIELFV